MINWKQDFTISVVMFGLSLAFGLTALGYPADANTFPLLLSGMLGVFSIALGAKSLMRITRGARLVEFRPYRGVMRQVLLTIAFILIVPVIGYALAGFLLCLCTAFNAGYGKRKTALLFSVAASVFVVAIFSLILHVPLPTGMLFG